MAECECGNEKAPLAEACERCLFLDGSSVREHELIALLRNKAYPEMLGGEIEAALGIAESYLRRVAIRLIDRGRLSQRRSHEFGSTESTGKGSAPALYKLTYRK